MHGRGAADPEKVKELQAKLAEKLAVYEVILSKQKYLAGDELTIADLNHLPVRLASSATSSLST